MRLDLAVSKAFGLSRRAARTAVRAGRVDLDGAVADEPGLEVGDNPELDFSPGRPARYRVRTRLSVLAEDEDFLVVDKPAGLLTVPTAEREKDTLLSRVLDYLHHRYRRRPVAFVVHRLDRDTSGAVVFARTRPALHLLQDLFRRHVIDREYLALVEGSLEPSGTFSADLAGDGVRVKRGVAAPGQRGKRAVTHFRTIERLPHASLVAIRLETGRTHQIRVHFASAGHPVVGDRVYGQPARESKTGGGRAAPGAPRQMLHARLLGFPHPRTGEPVRTESPLPADFREALDFLRRRSGPRGREPRADSKTKAPRKGPRGAQN
jgi:23S rRNA pseudouridine1911/1915/1917 synthase